MKNLDTYNEFINEGLFIKRYHQKEIEELFQYIKDNFNINNLRRERKNDDYFYFYTLDNGTKIIATYLNEDILIDDEKPDISRWLRIKIVGFFHKKWNNKEKEEEKLREEKEKRRKLDKFRNINDILSSKSGNDEQFEKDFEE